MKVHRQERYEYARLEDGHIRLLEIKSKSQVSLGGFLEARLISISLEKAKERGYEALSYTWQEEKPSHPILVDGNRIDITSNLRDLLLARRRSLSQVNRVVWVDAICINQADVQGEKPAQILMMKDIYRNASRVIGWLGDDWNSSLAAEMIIDVDATLKIFDWNEMQFYDNWRWTKDGPRWQALVQAVCHSYFSRAWICQEIVLGHQFQFYLGGHYISWHTFSNVIMHLTQPGLSSLLQQNATPASPKVNYFMDNVVMISCIRGFGNSMQYPLGVLLFMFARLGAGEPQDKIYALLGLSNTRLSQKITPNYTKADQDMVFN
ncbi:hypothetical protein LTR85_000949 [Meristemomyces frigidus]|nr:hypothetical protein LTR85_000949 [Meristemomyces frigidus]